MLRLFLLAALFCAPAIAAAEVFRATTERFSIQQDYDAQAQALFGPEFRLAEWRDVSARYAREGGVFLRAAGMVMRGQDGPSSAAVTVNGERFHRGSRRHYFVAWGEVPASFLVHERAMYQGVPLNLGSWHSDRRILAVAPASAVPADGTQDSATRNMLGALRTGLSAAGFDEGATAINFVSGAAEISIAVRQRDPNAVREALAGAVVSFMPVAMRGSTSVLGIISEPVLVDGELKVRVTLPFRFLRTGDPRALDCGADNPECRF